MLKSNVCERDSRLKPFVCEGYSLRNTYLTETEYEVAFQKSISAKTCQYFWYYYSHKT